VRRSTWNTLLPALVLAAGVIVSTLLTKLTVDQGGWVLLGPALMAAALVGAARTAGTAGRMAGLLAAALVLGAIVVALRDPQRLAALMPVLGAVTAAPLVTMRREEPERACYRRT
jgi:hypothetical protein